MRRVNTEKLTDLFARVVVGTLFLLLSKHFLEDFLRTGRFTGLLLVISELLVVVLTVVRRRATIVDRSALAATVTILSVGGPPMVRASAAGGIAPDILTALLSTAGLLVVIAGKVTLGRSFGIAPANRGVVAAGPYQLVRHPIYAGYLITHVGFLAAHPTLWNMLILVVADTALVVRALIEERVLVRDERYRDYCTRVGWHLVPGVF
jgi:protein-S-isoprenylcysteine O-methyltransferase Ste14